MNDYYSTRAILTRLGWILVFGLMAGGVGVALVAATTPPIWASGAVGIISTLLGIAIGMVVGERRRQE